MAETAPCRYHGTSSLIYLRYKQAVGVSPRIQVVSRYETTHSAKENSS